VTSAADLVAVINAVEESVIIGVDTETTGLDARKDRIRLLSLNTDTEGGRFTYLVDCFAVDPSPLWESLSARPLVLHNGIFDLQFLARMGFVPGTVHDTRLLAQLLSAGTSTMYKCGLEDVVKAELGRDLDKTHQKSDWSGTLTSEQLKYAAADAAVLGPLYEKLSAKVKAAKMERAAAIEERCLPGLAWLASNGVSFDRQKWEGLAASALADAERLRSELDAAAGAIPGSLSFDLRNWNSNDTVKQALAHVGVAVDKTDDDTLAGIDHPLAALLRDYRDAQKRASTYGHDWLKHVSPDGKVYADWKQCGAKTGRMACGDPNLQNVPNDPDYRRCFRAPPGRVLVKADYSQIELRIAAKVANEKRMIEAYRRGDDLHAMTARSMTGKTEITAGDRKLAKPVNFGLIYGLQAKSLARKAKVEYGVELSVADAERYRTAFFTSYPAIQQWHSQIKRRRATETRSLVGRRVLVDADAFYGGKANYVVQGTGGDGMKLALALLWERRREVPGAFPVMQIHDELVVECDEGQADAGEAWLKRAMIDGMAMLVEPVPVAVEVKVAQTWGG
jgi:DNA polymerase-1